MERIEIENNQAGRQEDVDGMLRSLVFQVIYYGLGDLSRSLGVG